MNQSPAAESRICLSTRFALAVGAIVFTLCTASSLTLYYYLKEKAIEETYEKSKVVFALMEGVGAYVRETLRPRMFELLKELPVDDQFVVEAMSTTRIKHGITHYFGKAAPHFVYRRVSEHPLNPENSADAFHSGMIPFFAGRPEVLEWHGLATIDGKPHFLVLRPIVTKAECLRCHGDPKQAPPGLVKEYGVEQGFGRTVGEIAGLESVSIPVDIALAHVRQLAFLIFGFGLLLMLFLFFAIEGTFFRLVSQPLRHLADRFLDISRGSQPLGREIPVLSKDEIGELTASFNTMARHLAEAQETLQSNAEVLQSIIDGISDPLALANPDCSLTVLNNAYQSWFARESPAVLGKKCHELAHQTGTLCPACLMGKVLKSREQINGEWLGPDGRTYFTQFYPVRDEEGNVVQVVHYIRDISLHKQAESQMMQAEKMAAMGQLSAGVAHEINNPLSTILCYTKLLLREALPECDTASDLKVIEKHAQGCKRIVDNLLSFARHEETRKTKADLNAGLGEIVRMVRKQFEKEGVKLLIEQDPAIPSLLLDREKMKQVYLNLLMNAKQAMPEGGTIIIGTTYLPKRNRVEIRFRDTGVGIEPEIVSRIFDPFFTTKKTGEGTGLGLSVSYGIVKEHFGDIIVESKPGTGSTFIVTLPLESGHDRRNIN